MPHLIFVLFTALVISAAMAAVENRAPRARLYVALRMFLWFCVSVVGGSWLMRLIHG